MLKRALQEALKCGSKIKFPGSRYREFFILSVEVGGDLALSGFQDRYLDMEKLLSNLIFWNIITYLKYISFLLYSLKLVELMFNRLANINLKFQMDIIDGFSFTHSFFNRYKAF